MGDPPWRRCSRCDRRDVRGLAVSWKFLDSWKHSHGNSPHTSREVKGHLFDSTGIEGEIIVKLLKAGFLMCSCRLMAEIVPLTARSRRQQISRLDREFEDGERRRCVPVSGCQFFSDGGFLRSLDLCRGLYRQIQAVH